MRDFVRVHKALLDSLGVKKLVAAAGASRRLAAGDAVGGRIPRLRRARGRTSSARASTSIPTCSSWLNVWAAPIKLDPNWKGGDYYGGAEPDEGLAQALTIVSLTTLHFAWAEKVHGYKWAAEGKEPR